MVSAGYVALTISPLIFYNVTGTTSTTTLDKPVILDWLNLNLNQARGPYQLSWTLTFGVGTSQLGPSTVSLNWVPLMGP